ncbi:MAG: hypothetical protein AVDCRST_MAG88-437, partial [uncultured Thermomicrobiales bacterium]
GKWGGSGGRAARGGSATIPRRGGQASRHGGRIAGCDRSGLDPSWRIRRDCGRHDREHRRDPRAL